MADDDYYETITRNKQAYHDYFVEEEYEAGLKLVGTEVKSLRDHRVHLSDAYATFQDNELYLVNAHIAPYPKASHDNHEPERPRKLLLHRHELNRIQSKVEQSGYTLIPLELYFKSSHVKVNLGVCEGKKQFDKRQDIKEREHAREMAREHARHRDEMEYKYDEHT